MRKLICLCLALLLACTACVATAEESWICFNDDTQNTGNFCTECGTPRPVVDSWTCPACGKTGLTGAFCSECGTPRPAESEAATCEGAGYATPDEAARAYVEALNAGDASAALSTFAVETFVDHVDPAAYLDYMRSFLLAVSYRGVPDVGPLIHGLLVERRRSEISLGIYYSWMRYATLGTDYEVAGSGEMLPLQEEGAIEDFLGVLRAATPEQWVNHIRITDVCGPEDPQVRGDIPDAYFGEQIQKNLERQLAILGGDEFAQRIVRLEVNGVEGMQLMQCVRYGDRWYNYTPQSMIATILGMDVMFNGFILGAIGQEG